MQTVWRLFARGFPIFGVLGRMTLAPYFIYYLKILLPFRSEGTNVYRNTITHTVLIHHIKTFVESIASSGAYEFSSAD